jgi:hypothetical protein
MTRLSIFAVTTGLIVQCALAQTTTPTNLTRTVNLTTFGLGSTETARVNLTNLASNSSNGTAASCTGSVAFINSAGTAVGTATNFTIASGVTSSVSLPFANSGLTAPRGTLRAQVTVTRPSTGAAPCALEITLETFETSSGATHLFTTAGEDVRGFERR